MLEVNILIYFVMKICEFGKCYCLRSQENFVVNTNLFSESIEKI